MIRLTLAIILVTFYIQFCVAKPRDRVHTMPKPCIGKNFCFVHRSAYPEEIIQHLLKNKTTYIPRVEPGDIGFDFRYGNDEEICKTYTKKSAEIYHIIDEFGNFRDVVQSGTIVKQTVNVEECVNPGRIETDTTGAFNSVDLVDYNVTCEQTTIDYKLIVLKEDRSGFEMARVKNGIPVCCSCKVYL